MGHLENITATGSITGDGLDYGGVLIQPPTPGVNKDFDDYLEVSDRYEIGEVGLDTQWYAPEPDDGGGQESSRVVVEEYPGAAGKGLMRCPIEFEERDHTCDAPSHLLDPDTWALACWLMTSGLSGKARDKFFKLKKVRIQNKAKV
jgi:hypothetical protein